MKTKEPIKIDEVSDLDSGYEALFNANDAKPEAPIKAKKEKKEPIKEDPSKEIRVTLQMNKELHKKIKIMAHWELSSIKDIVNIALSKNIAEYEKTHGPLVNVPKSQKTK